MRRFPCFLEEVLLNKLKPYPRRTKMPPGLKIKTAVYKVISNCAQMMCASVGVGVLLKQTNQDAIICIAIALYMAVSAIILEINKE